MAFNGQQKEIDRYSNSLVEIVKLGLRRVGDRLLERKKSGFFQIWLLPLGLGLYSLLYFVNMGVVF